MKDFIIRMPDKIADLPVLCTAVNEFGVTINFYYINKTRYIKYHTYARRHFINIDRLLSADQNLEELEGHIKWKANMDAIAIIDKPYRLALFIEKSEFDKLNTYTHTDIFKD